MTRPDFKLPGRHVGIISDPPSISERDSIHRSGIAGVGHELINKWNYGFLVRGRDGESLNTDSSRIFKKIPYIGHGKFQIYEIQIHRLEGAIVNVWNFAHKARALLGRSDYAYEFR